MTVIGTACATAVAGTADSTARDTDRPAAVCERRAADQRALERLRTVMSEGRFVAYEPTSIRMQAGHLLPADPDGIRADLAELRARFDGLITYGALGGHEAIPGIAAELGFRALVIGIWDPFQEPELEAALQAARRYPNLVQGFSIGNEMVFAHRRTAAELATRIRAIRVRAPAVPLATTEPFHIFYDPATPTLERELDFLLVNVHPIFQPWFRAAPDANAAAFVVNVVDRLARGFCGPILVKETGVPTEPATSGFTAARQASFYAALGERFLPARDRAFAYFAAFDAPWRVTDIQASPGVHPEEAHWGLYDEHRQAKPVVGGIPPLEPPAVPARLPEGPRGGIRYN
jgi:exo-beta-1,3-glucanase (GH17 family)